MILDPDGLAALGNAHLATLRGLPGAPALEAGWSPGQAAGWSPARAAAGPGSVDLSGVDAEAAACDATITPVVSGQPDWTALDQLTTLFVKAHGRGLDHHRDHGQAPGHGHGRDARDRDGPAEPAGISPALRRLRDTLLDMSITLLSGPGGLASCLRATTLGEPYNSLSQPLDMGAPTPQIPPHLRKAVTQRDKHCQFPGCAQPPSVCQVHHLIPRAKDGPTALGNLRLLCRFHHLIVIHRWGWKLTCHPNGTTTPPAPTDAPSTPTDHRPARREPTPLFGRPGPYLTGLGSLCIGAWELAAGTRRPGPPAEVRQVTHLLAPCSAMEIVEAYHDPVERGQRAVRSTVRLTTPAIGRPRPRCGDGGDQAHRAAIRRPWLRQPDGTGVW